MPDSGEVLSGVRTIAVLRPNAVGDFIFALPALHALRAAYPAARIIYIGKAWHAEFLRDRPGPIDDVAVIPPCPGVGAPLQQEYDEGAVDAFVASMRSAEIDLAVQIYGGGRYANPFIRRLGARLSVGLKALDAEPLDRWIAYASLQNKRLLLLEAAALAGARSLELGRELEVTERDRTEAAQVMGPATAQPLVLIQPGSSDARRRWPASSFARVADVLAAAGAVIAVHGTAAEAAVVREVIGHMRHPAFDLSGKVSLSGLCGLLARSALLVSNDTGPLHLALAVGTPAVGIYWLTNLYESGPLLQDRHRAALATRSLCPVCGAENLTQRCPHDESFVADVPVAEVTEMALELLRRRGMDR